MAEQFRITTDATFADSIFVHVQDGVTIRFDLVSAGIFLVEEGGLDIIDGLKAQHKKIEFDDSKRTLTDEDLVGFNKAKALFEALGTESFDTTYSVIRNNMIPGCSVTVTDLENMRYLEKHDKKAKDVSKLELITDYSHANFVTHNKKNYDSRKVQGADNA